MIEIDQTPITELDYENVEWLANIARYEGTELGEYWEALSYMYTRVEYGSEKFQKAVEEELLSQINYIKKHVKVIKITETRTINEIDLEFS